MPHRPPTRFDIGREVEVKTGDTWSQSILLAIEHRQSGTTYQCDGYRKFDADCRVPYTTSDPIAELSAAADWLAELGQDEAASILLKAVAAMNEGRDIIGKCPLGIHFEAPYLRSDWQAWYAHMQRQAADVLGNPPEPQP